MQMQTKFILKRLSFQAIDARLLVGRRAMQCIQNFFQWDEGLHVRMK